MEQDGEDGVNGVQTPDLFSGGQWHPEEHAALSRGPSGWWAGPPDAQGVADGKHMEDFL